MELNDYYSNETRNHTFGSRNSNFDGLEITSNYDYKTGYAIYFSVGESPFLCKVRLDEGYKVAYSGYYRKLYLVRLDGDILKLRFLNYVDLRKVFDQVVDEEKSKE